jgi:hypothetical protein
MLMIVTVQVFFLEDQFRGLSSSSWVKDTTMGSAKALVDVELDSSSGGVASRTEMLGKLFSRSVSDALSSPAGSVSSDTQGRLGSSNPVTSSG